MLKNIVKMVIAIIASAFMVLFVACTDLGIGFMFNCICIAGAVFCGIVYMFVDVYTEIVMDELYDGCYSEN